MKVLAFRFNGFLRMSKCYRYSIVLFILAQLAFFSEVDAQNPSLPPSGNFDLTEWKITLPDQSEVTENDLSNGFESANEFYTDPTTGAMVFVCRNDGKTGGSTYPRSELREMLRAGNTSISTKGIGLNNWVFSSSSQTNREASGGVDGTMTATVAVDHVSTTGESNKVGRVIIGQIHASNDEPCRLYYRKLPGNTKGSIYFAHEPTTGSEQWYDMIGSRSSSASNPFDGIALGERFSYEIKVVGNMLTVTIMRDGKPDLTRDVDMTASGFENDWMYFKAGNYNQNNSGDPGDYCQVSFFALNKSHSSPKNNAPSTSITGPSNKDTFVEGDNITITADASDSDGSITKVEFYQGNTKLGEDLTSPYSYLWNNVTVGNYVLSAKATDNGNVVTTSASVSIEVIPVYNAPYEIPRFQDFIGGSKLQAPTSSTVATQADLINGYADANFYVVDDNKVAFNQTGSSMRTELRHLENWDLTDDDRFLHARIDVVEQTCDQVTIVQIHDDANAGSGPNKPLLRIYKHLTKAPANHLWAAIKKDAGGDNTSHVDLGADPGGYFDCDVQLEEGRMTIKIDGAERVNKDVSYWAFPSYWKAGVYLQDEGKATAYFDELEEALTVNTVPSVSITEPSDGASFDKENVTIRVNASDPDGRIVKVEFYEGSNKLGEDTSSPYSYIWKGVSGGSYDLSAVAIDNAGGSSTSSLISVTVSGSGQVLSAAVKDESDDFTIFPNPFSSSIVIEFVSDKLTPASVSIHNVSGQLLDQVAIEVKNLGVQKAVWNAPNNYPNGLYFIRLNIGEESKSLRIILDR